MLDVARLRVQAATFSLLARFTQTMSVGGSSLTLQTADAVRPTGPLRATQVTIFTAAPRRAMASRNVFRSTIMWDHFRCRERHDNELAELDVRLAMSMTLC